MRQAAAPIVATQLGYSTGQRAPAATGRSTGRSHGNLHPVRRPAGSGVRRRGSAGRVAMVRDFLATSDELAATRRNPHAPEYQETVLSCLHVILEEEWEHHRYAVRDLDAVEAQFDA